MQISKGFITVLVLCGVGYCAETEKIQPKPAPPTVSSELEIRFLRALLEQADLVSRMDKVQVSIKSTHEEIVAACGSGFLPQETKPESGKAVHIICTPKTPGPIDKQQPKGQ